MMGDNGWDDPGDEFVGPPGRCDYAPPEERKGNVYPSRSRGERKVRERLQATKPSSFFPPKEAPRKPQGQRMFWGPEIIYLLTANNQNSNFIKNVAGWYLLKGFITQSQKSCLEEHLLIPWPQYLGTYTKTVSCPECRIKYTHMLGKPNFCPQCWGVRYGLP